MSLLKIPERAEELQGAALFALSCAGMLEHVAFYGGTALRILHGLERFSEDLDFTVRKPGQPFDLRDFLPSLQSELRSMGYAFSVEAKEKAVPTSVQSAFLKASTQALLLQLRPDSAPPLPTGSIIRIKIEVDTEPPLAFSPVLGLVRHPTLFQVPTLGLPDLFAGKLFAALFRDWKGRTKGRDWYDVLWYLRKGVPVSYEVFQGYLRQKDPSLKIGSLQDLILLLESRIESLDWEAVRRDVSPFVLKRQDIEALDPRTVRHALELLQMS